MGVKMHLLGFPILSIDCKKTEKIGQLKNNGREWMPQGVETKVNVYDFGQQDEHTKKLKTAIPSGIYDLLKKQGFVNVGIDATTAEFACASARAVVEDHWETRVSRGLRTPAVCRLRQQEWLQKPLVEIRSATGCQPHRTACPCLSLSAGNLEMERDRTCHVCLYHDQLAGQTPDRLRSGLRTHRAYDH
jgi:hypothetical protein